MNLTKLFQHGVPAIFASDEEKERRELDQIAAAHAKRKSDEHVLRLFATRKDFKAQQEAVFQDLVGKVKLYASLPDAIDQFASSLAAEPNAIDPCARALAGVLAVKDNLPAIVKAVSKHTLEIAAKELADFEREHGAVLARYPKLEPMEELPPPAKHASSAPVDGIGCSDFAAPGKNDFQVTYD